jgi:hypothetical protein
MNIGYDGLRVKDEREYDKSQMPTVKGLVLESIYPKIFDYSLGGYYHRER